jgi:hypothetical protein
MLSAGMERDPAGAADERFFERLPAIERFTDVLDTRWYAPAPSTWDVILTDVVGSTRAIQEGRYKDVNAVGAGSIVAVRNAVPDVELAFVFGGDGATLLVPASRRDAVDRALRGSREVAMSAFGLELRVARVPLDALRAAGHELLVARYALGASVSIAVLAGDGVMVAERWVKDPDVGGRFAIGAGEADADFTGFECRWQPLESQHGAVLSLLVLATAPGVASRTATYRRVLDGIEAIVAGHPPSPASLANLRLGASADAFSQEARLRSGRASGFAHRRARLGAGVATLIGRALLGTGLRLGGFDGQRYRAEVVQNTDFRKFDEMLRMVIDVTADEHHALLALLEAERAGGHVVYGCHPSAAALMTCMIGDYSARHLHFVDGADGGYALAARQLKRQLGEITSREDGGHAF